MQYMKANVIGAPDAIIQSVNSGAEPQSINKITGVTKSTIGTAK